MRLHHRLERALSPEINKCLILVFSKGTLLTVGLLDSQVLSLTLKIVTCGALLWAELLPG